jgi:hypothetical protein
VGSLAVWVYDRTGESMLVAMLMHASLSAGALILEPLGLVYKERGRERPEGKGIPERSPAPFTP